MAENVSGSTVYNTNRPTVCHNDILRFGLWYCLNRDFLFPEILIPLLYYANGNMK